MDTSNDWTTISMNTRKNKKKQIVHTEKNSNKKILCFNVLNVNLCIYGNKCMYAHSLKEQTMNDNRRIVYDMLQMKDLSHINLLTDVQLCEDLTTLTTCIFGHI